MSVTVKPGITAVFNNLGHKTRLIGTQKFWVIQYQIYCWWQCKELATYIILYKPGHLNAIICFVVIPSNCIAIIELYQDIFTHIFVNIVVISLW